MVEYSGKMLSCAGETVTGRLCRSDICADRAKEHSESARILLWDGRNEIPESLLSSTVGVVLTSEPKEYSTLSNLSHIPVLSVQTVGDSLQNDGTIAIIDGKRQKIYINPDIETVKGLLYNSKQIKASAPTYIFWHEGKCAPIMPEGFQALAAGHGFCGDEDTTYEYFCDIADKNTGARLYAVLDMACEESARTAKIRAVYRAGVWGRLSLLCGGINTPTVYERCIFSMHSAFRELDRDNREFNGFIPKGMIIDTPLMLLFRPKINAFDFYCLDIDKLVKGFCGGESADIIHIYKYIENFASSVSGSKICILSRGEPTEVLCDMLFSMCGTLDIYTSRKIF